MTTDFVDGGEGLDRPDHGPGDRMAERLLGGPLTVLVALICLIQLLTWAPHYLSWPLWADHDVFATLARGWDAGLLPYRDLRCNQFPGEIYLFYFLGRVAGWGHGAPIYAFDVVALLALGFGLTAWSRRSLGRALPGLVGYLAFLSYYLSLDYMMAAQRDWHSALLAVLGILVLQGSRGRVAGPAIAGAAMSMAVSIRPHAILFLPAVALQFLGEIRGGRDARRLASWIGSFLLTTIAWILPLVASGVWSDFIAGVRGNNAAAADRGFRVVTMAVNVLRQLDAFSIVAVVIAIGLLLMRDRRRSPGAAVWLVALGFALMYEPISPRFHSYLRIPLNLVLAVNVAVLTSLILTAGRLPRSFQLLGLLLILGMACRIRPEFCALRPSLKAAAAGMRAELAEAQPPGYRRKADSVCGYYDWADYRAMLEYLRRWPSKDTKVANVLPADPAVVGWLGRLPALPAESIAWLHVVNPGEQDRFAEALEAAPDSVVVWTPTDAGPDPSFEIDRLRSAIRRLYEPDARFGIIEVWRRKASATPGASLATRPAARPGIGG